MVLKKYGRKVDFLIQNQSVDSCKKIPLISSLKPLNFWRGVFNFHVTPLISSKLILFWPQIKCFQWRMQGGRGVFAPFYDFKKKIYSKKFQFPLKVQIFRPESFNFLL